jgi:uncharacterized protein (TIGR03084 family)
VDEVLDALRGQVDELDGLVAPLDDAGWSSPSACPEWTVADVVLHLAQTNEMATASARGALADAAGSWAAVEGDTVDDLAGAAVARERGGPNGELYRRWRSGADEMVAAFASCDPADRLTWVVGDMAARTLATTRVAETWIHTEDVADGLGVTLRGSPRLWHVARLVHRTIPYAFARAGEEPPGPVAFQLSAPDGDDTWTFGDAQAPTVVTGPALDLCRVAGQRGSAEATQLTGVGPDAEQVLALMRTFA